MKKKIIIIIIIVLAILIGGLLYYHFHHKCTETSYRQEYGPNVDKPIIYLYPEKEMNIEVKLPNKEYITVSYPKYVNGWNVKAYPDGTLIDNNTGRKLYSLYYEGFIVKGEDTISFLEEKLEILGLNEKEAEEFIVYWLPKLEVNKYNYIYFASIDEINEKMPLELSETPDTFIRILMMYKPLDKKININEQKLTTVTRSGFAVVEWGGALIK